MKATLIYCDGFSRSVGLFIPLEVKDGVPIGQLNAGRPDSTKIYRFILVTYDDLEAVYREAWR